MNKTVHGDESGHILQGGNLSAVGLNCTRFVWIQFHEEGLAAMEREICNDTIRGVSGLDLQPGEGEKWPSSLLYEPTNTRIVVFRIGLVCGLYGNNLVHTHTHTEMQAKRTSSTTIRGWE